MIEPTNELGLFHFLNDGARKTDKTGNFLRFGGGREISSIRGLRWNRGKAFADLRFVALRGFEKHFGGAL
jgi:hypothetical protein